MAISALHEDVKVVTAVKPASFSAGALALGEEIDTSGFSEAEFVVLCGTFTATGDTLFAVHECATSGGSYAAVTDGALPEITVSTDNDVFILRVDLSKRLRFLKLTYDVDDDSAIFGAACLLRGQRNLPVTQVNTVVSV